MNKNATPCPCDWHKEYNFVKSLKKSLTSVEFKQLEKVFEEKWVIKEDLSVAEAKINETWPGSKYKKSITDMFKLKWIDNLTYVELLERAGKL